MKQKFLILALTLMTCLSASAANYDFMVDNIAYKKYTGSTSGNWVYVTYTTTSSPTSSSYSSYTGDITIPSTVTYNDVTYTVYKIGDEAFAYCSDITSIILPNSLQYIGNKAFYWCRKITSVSIPERVSSIGEWAFSGCSKLTDISIPEKVTKINDYTFYGCSSLESINIPRSVTSIGECAFRDCSSLTSINIPNSVTSIGPSAFSGCSKLTSIDLPETITAIESHTFYGCKSMETIKIHGKITTIGQSAFDNGPMDITFYNTENLRISSALFPVGTVIRTLSKEVISCSDYAFGTYTIVANNMSGYLTVKNRGTVYVIPELVQSYKANQYWGLARIYPLNFSQIEDIKISQDHAKINVGDTVQLSVNVPEGFSSDLISWKSEDETVATVSQEGIVTAKSKGVTVVKATNEETKLNVHSVIAVVDPILAEEVKLDTTQYTIHVGSKGLAKASIFPELTKDKSLKWTSKDENIVKIDSTTGEFTGVKAGSTIINATTQDGSNLIAKAVVSVIDGVVYDFTKPSQLTPALEAPEEEDSYTSYKDANLFNDQSTLSFGMGSRTGTYSFRVYSDENLNYYIKAYTGGTITITGKDKNKITKVVFNGESIDLTPNNGIMSGSIWEGNTESVTFTINAANTIQTIMVEYTPISNISIDDKEEEPFDGDVNKDGQTDVTDVTTLINYIIGQ